MPQLLRTWWTHKQSFQQRTQVQAGSTYNDRKVIAGVDLIQSLAREQGIIARSEKLRWRNNINQMVGHAGPLFWGGFRSADFKFPVNRYRIATDNLCLQ